MNTSSAPSTETNPVTEEYDPIDSDKKALMHMSDHYKIPVIFKKQRAWVHGNSKNINLIKASVNKCDMPRHSLVVWCESNLPVFRYTGGQVIKGRQGYQTYTKHFEIQQCANQLYINGTDFRGTINSLRMLLKLMICTYPVLEHVYGIDIREEIPVYSVI